MMILLPLDTDDGKRAIARLRRLGIVEKHISGRTAVYDVDESHPAWPEVQKLMSRPSAKVPHRLLEKRFAKMLGQCAGEMPSMPMTRREHRLRTQLWREAAPDGTAGTAHVDLDALRAAAREVYRDLPPVLTFLQL